MKNAIPFLSLALILAIAGCDSDVRTQSAIHLPEGDPQKGKAEFVSLGCVNCHVVLNAELPEVDGPLRVVLGSSTRINSYGDLVTSVVNPSHKLSYRYAPDAALPEGESPMTNYNDVMTVSQLSNLVAFLEQHYQRINRPRYQYRRYEEEIPPSADRKRAGLKDADEAPEEDTEE